MPRKRKPAAKAAAIEVDSAIYTTETNISANDTRGNDAVEQQAEESEKGAVKSIDGRCAGETAVEMNYCVQITPWLVLQPDYQYIIDPGADAAIDDAHVMMLRLELAL
jgi:carbohydrate-selective porin OprB